MIEKIKLSNYIWTDLHKYPNVGYDKTKTLTEFSFNGNGLLRQYITGEEDVARRIGLILTEASSVEYKKCNEDKLYFFETYLKIQTLDDGIISFTLRPYQKEFLQIINDNNKVIGLLSRQIGKCFNKDTKITIRNKKTGKVEKITIERFNQLIKSKERQSNNYVKSDVTNISCVATLQNNKSTQPLLSNKTIRKFIESNKVDEYEILTEDGFKDIVTSNKTIKYQVYVVTLENGLNLKCADTHIFIDENYNEIYAKDSLHTKLRTKKGVSKVVNVETLEEYDNMYDLEINSEEHTYYTNDILSHNTTMFAAEATWRLCFEDDYTIGVAANTAELSLEIVAMIKQMFELLPQWIKPSVKVWNAKSIKLGNNNKVISSVFGANTFRGKTVSMACFDEFAHSEESKIKALMDSAMPSLSSGRDTKLIILSTPKGYNTFQSIYKQAKEGVNGYAHYYANWRVRTDRDEEWKAKEIASTSLLQFMQNHEATFLGSSATLLNVKTLEKLTAKKKKHIDTNTQIHHDLKIYEYPIEPNSNVFYTIGLDSAKISPSSSKMSDFLSIQVLMFNKEKKRIKQVATIKTKDGHYTEISKVMYDLGTYYNNALVLVENNEGAGTSISDSLFNDFEYENIFRSTDRPDLLGFRTTQKTKRYGLSNMKKLLEDGILELVDVDTVNDFFTFVRTGVSYAAQDSECHDDTIMALNGALQFLTDELNEEEFTLTDLFEPVNRDENGEEVSGESSIYSEDLDFIGSSNVNEDDDSWLMS